MDPDRALQLLAGERERIERALARLGHQDTGEPADEEDPGNLASDLYQDELDEGLADDLREELAAVERAAAPQLDAAWTAAVAELRAGELGELLLIVGGRSLGARVACRTSDAVGALAVLCLAFPLEPPQRAGKPPQTRLAELDAVTVPTL